MLARRLSRRIVDPLNSLADLEHPLDNDAYGGALNYYLGTRSWNAWDAINKGIRVATGDVIGLLHSDDFFYNNGVISRIVEHM